MSINNNITKTRTVFTAPRTQVFISICVSVYAIWIDWSSFGNWDFSDLVWLIAVLILSIIVGVTVLAQRSFSVSIWVVFGALCWSAWRFSEWIFVARSGWIIGLIGLLTYPLQELLRMDVVEITLYGLTILIVVFSLWGTYWVYKNFDPAWLNIRRAVWGVLIGIIILVVIHTNQQYSMGYCFGINSLSSSLSCEIRNYLGVVGSTWVVITFILWAITYMSRQVKKYGGLSILWLVVLEPVWIMMFFNPTRILGVVLLNVIRSPEDLGFLNQLLTTNMRLLNILPIVAFFLLIPSGLFLLNSKEMQLRWTVLGSAVSLLIILGLLFFSLIISKSVFSYSIIDHLIFVLMAVQLWMPLLIGSHIVNDIHTA